MKLQTRFVASISVGIVAVLLISEIVRQYYESVQLANLEKSNPERMEAAMHASLAPIAESVASSLGDAMAEGNMDLFGKILSRQGSVEGVLEVALYGAGGKAVYASSSSAIGKHMDPGLLALIKIRRERQDRRVGQVFEIYQPFIAGEACLGCHGDWNKGDVGGVLGVRISNQSFLRAQEGWISAVKSIRESNFAMGALVSLALVAALVIIIRALVRRLIIRPLGMATRFVERISQGDLTRTMDHGLRDRNDELGVLAKAMEAMAKRLREILASILSGVQTIGSASAALSAVASQTATGVARMGAKSETATRAAQGSQAHVQSVATAITDAAENLSSAAKATDDMGASIVAALQQSAQAKETTEQATSKASNISASIASLDEAAKAIDQVTEAITGISAQTNLLALNATIEAARAGALGKGFAVVATEIKELAAQTARATQDVKEKIASVQSSTATALVDLQTITTVIQEVGHTVSETAAAMTEHADVSKRVVDQLEQTAKRVSHASHDVASSATASASIATDIGEVNVAAGEIRRGGEQVQEKAKELLNLARDLTGLVEQFKLSEA
jgi:methyl-accepting chemotaxis protein